MIPYNLNLKGLSKSLRGNLTEAERCLWTRLKLKHLGYTFYRQKPIGDYIVDFYCPKAKLVVEVDGGQHYSRETTEYDKIRDEYLDSLRLRVLRFNNNEVLKNTDSVAEAIYKILLNPPLPKGDKRSGENARLHGKAKGKILLNPPLPKGDKIRVAGDDSKKKITSSPFRKGRRRRI